MNKHQAYCGVLEKGPQATVSPTWVAHRARLCCHQPASIIFTQEEHRPYSISVRG